MENNEDANLPEKKNDDMDDKSEGSGSPGKQALIAQSLIDDSKSLSYDDLLHRFETLLDKTEEMPVCEQRIVAKGLLAGAEELLLRQDEIGADFTVAIIALNEHASQHILAVIRKSDADSEVSN